MIVVFFGHQNQELVRLRTEHTIIKKYVLITSPIDYLSKIPEISLIRILLRDIHCVGSKLYLLKMLSVIAENGMQKMEHCCVDIAFFVISILRS